MSSLYKSSFPYDSSLPKVPHKQGHYIFSTNKTCQSKNSEAHLPEEGCFSRESSHKFTHSQSVAIAAHHHYHRCNITPVDPSHCSAQRHVSATHIDSSHLSVKCTARRDISATCISSSHQRRLAETDLGDSSDTDTEEFYVQKQAVYPTETTSDKSQISITREMARDVMMGNKSLVRALRPVLETKTKEYGPFTMATKHNNPDQDINADAVKGVIGDHLVDIIDAFDGPLKAQIRSCARKHREDLLTLFTDVILDAHSKDGKAPRLHSKYGNAKYGILKLMEIGGHIAAHHDPSGVVSAVDEKLGPLGKLSRRLGFR